MKIITKKPLATVGEDRVVVPPGRYELQLAELVSERREVFFFKDARFKGVFIGSSMLKLMEKIGLIKEEEGMNKKKKKKNPEIVRTDDLSVLFSHKILEGVTKIVDIAGLIAGVSAEDVPGVSNMIPRRGSKAFF